MYLWTNGNSLFAREYCDCT